MTGLKVRRTGPARVNAGQIASVKIHVTNTSRRSTTAGVLLDNASGLTGVSVWVPALSPGQDTEIVVDREVQGRGVWHGGVSKLSATDPFGMWREDFAADPAWLIVVHPALTRVNQSLLAGETVGAVRSRPVPGTGTEVLGLRPWRPGDPARAVNARASARHGRWWVLERERESSLGLVVLAGQGSLGPAWETAVSHAASLAVRATENGPDPVLLGRDALPGPGRTGVLDWFAGLGVGAPPDREQVAAAVRAAGPGGTLVFLTDSTDPAHPLVAGACRAARVTLTVPHV